MRSLKAALRPKKIIKNCTLLAGITIPLGLMAKVDSPEPKIHGSIACRTLNIRKCLDLAKIAANQAASTAKQKFPGKVLAVAAEIEDGYLVYSVTIGSLRSGTHEILVDAGDGKVLSNQFESREFDDPIGRNSKH